MIETDFIKTDYSADTVYCFNNYQPFVLHPQVKTEGLLLQFHPNFFCIETYQHEVGCNGLLFNSVFDIGPISIQESESHELLTVLRSIEQEKEITGIATNELVFSYLKIFLVKLTRLKTTQSPLTGTSKATPGSLEKLIGLINENCTIEHKAAFYANQLNVSIKSLSNTCRKHFRKGISALISEKLLLKAKWELLHTDKPVKQVADSLGFKDEYYFSRFFKKHIGLSPKLFREKEWEIRKGYLSIP
ncbi:HTH-type transcriptional activator Btr [compost metagenome]